MMLLSFNGKTPRLHKTVFVAPSAHLVGDVEIGEGSSIWFHVVARGDVHFIRIGQRTNIQDLSVLHVTRKTYPLVIGDEVTVGHRVTLHGCTLFNRAFIGMGATVLDGAVIEEEAMVGAGALITEGMKVPSHSLALGVPARITRPLTPEEISFLSKSAKNYLDLAAEYKKMTKGLHAL